MSATVFADLTADQQTIVLLAGGGDAAVAVAAKQLGLLTPLFSKSSPPGALTVAATWPAVVQLSQTFGAAWRPGPGLRTWIAEQVIARSVVEPTSTSSARTTYAPPAGLIPFPWQSAGAAMIAATGRALITDEPGTGKTATSILGLVERWETGAPSDPVLVVCPASVIDSWVEAWGTWAPHVRAVAWRGTPRKRQALAGTADVYVVGYETARMDAPVVNLKKLAPLRELDLSALVIDECHLIKNHQSARSQAVRRLAKAVQKRGGAVVALSGTPITHHPGDLWASLDALEHAAWPSRERWVQRYCQVLASNATAGPDEILGLLPAAEPEFRLCLLGQMRRVAKADVLSQLPPKTYSVRTVDLPSTSGNNWRKAYDDFEEQMIAELPSGEELSVMEVMAKFTHLTALASAPADVEITETTDADTGEVRRHVHLELKPGSWKVEALLEVLAERSGEPVVACAPSRQLVVLAGQAAAAQGLRVGYIVGGQSAAERTAAVNAFQAGELDLICVTTGAGGVGITLTAARTIVFLQRPWALVEAIQMEDRCHRIGSERHDSIEVIDIVALSTIDTRVRAVLRERAGQLSDLVQDPRVASELLGGADRTPTRLKEPAA